VDLFDGHSIALGGWTGLDGSGCFIWPAITRLSVAGRVWVSLAVGSQLGSQFGYPAVTRNRRNAAARRRPSG